MDLIRFIKEFLKKLQKDEINDSAIQITYRLVISMFPFITFLLSLIGYLNLDVAHLLKPVQTAFPSEILKLIDAFVMEVVDKKSVGVMSVSLGVLFLNTSAGYVTVAKSFSRAYDMKHEKSPLHLRIIGGVYVLIFAAFVLFSAIILVYGDQLLYLLPYNLYERLSFLHGITKYVVALLIIQIFVVFTYKLTSPIKLSYMEHIPGSIVTSLIWVISTKIFNIYVNNYSKYSMIYGSVASMFILMIWLNMISLVFILGCEINALLFLYRRKQEKTVF